MQFVAFDKTRAKLLVAAAALRHPLHLALGRVEREALTTVAGDSRLQKAAQFAARRTKVALTAVHRQHHCALHFLQVIWAQPPILSMLAYKRRLVG